MKAWDLGYEEAKNKALSIYSVIGSTRCEALGGEEIYFTRAGFSHLVRKGKNPRTHTEQMKRFSLIPLAVQILNNPQAAVEYRKDERSVELESNGEKIKVISVAEFWTFAEKVGDCTIKVVVRHLSVGGHKHFFSIMGDNVVVEKGQYKDKKSRR